MKKYKSCPVFGFDYHPNGMHGHSENIIKLKKKKKNRTKNKLARAHKKRTINANS